MEERTLLDVCDDLLMATEALKHLVAVGTITENEIKDFNNLKGACIDFISAYEYYLNESCQKPYFQF